MAIFKLKKVTQCAGILMFIPYLDPFFPPLALRISKMGYPAMPSEFHNYIIKPPSHSDFPFFHQTLQNSWQLLKTSEILG